MKRLIVVLFLLTGSAHGTTLPCEELVGIIGEKLQARGVRDYELKILPANLNGEGKEVGSCEGGKKKVTYSTKKKPTQTISPLPNSPFTDRIPIASSVQKQLSIEAKNYSRLINWTNSVRALAGLAVKENKVDLYRSATVFRDKLLPYNFQFFSAHSVAQELLRSGYSAREAETPAGQTAIIVACKGVVDCRSVDPRVALFMTPITLLASHASVSAQPTRPPPIRPLISLPFFAGISQALPASGLGLPQVPGQFPVMPGGLPFPVPIPVPHPLPLPLPQGPLVPQVPIPVPGGGKIRVCVPWC
jgi:hypothetical protein